MKIRRQSEMLRVRAPIEIIAESIRFVGRNYQSLFGSVMVIAGPLLVLSTAVFYWYWSAMEPWSTTSRILEDIERAVSEPAYYVVAFTSILAQIALVGTTYVYIVLYAENDQAPSLSDLWNRTVHEAGVLLSTSLGSLAIFLGLFLLNIIPCLGTVLFVALTFYGAIILMPVYVVRLWEPTTLIGALRRCYVLVRPYFVDTLVVFMLGAFLYFLLILLLAIPATLLTVESEGSGWMSHLVTAITSLAGSLILIFPLAVGGVHAFNLLRRETRDRSDEEEHYDPSAIAR